MKATNYLLNTPFFIKKAEHFESSLYIKLETTGHFPLQYGFLIQP